MAREKLTKTKIDCVYSYKQNGVKKFAYRYKYYDHFGIRKEKTKQGFTTIQLAERSLIEVKAAVLDGNESFINNEQLKLSIWIDRWFEFKRVRWEPSTEVLYVTLVKNYLKPKLGHYPLKQLTKLKVQSNLVDAMHEEQFSKNTIRLCTQLLKSILNDAVSENIISKVPYTKLDLSKIPDPKKRDTLQMDEIKFLLECTEKENITRRTILKCLIYTGMRGGEAIALRVGDIDLENKLLRIDETIGQHKASGGRPKTNNSYRSLKIPEPLMVALEEYFEWFESKMIETGKNITDDSRLFIISVGSPIGSAYISKIFRDFKSKYELYLTAHILRHTYASILISQNIPVTTVAKLLGDTVETVVTTYVHSIDEQELIALEVMNNITN